jgi:hypothetical protein
MQHVRQHQAADHQQHDHDQSHQSAAARTGRIRLSIAA